MRRLVLAAAGAGLLLGTLARGGESAPAGSPAPPVPPPERRPPATLADVKRALSRFHERLNGVDGVSSISFSEDPPQIVIVVDEPDVVGRVRRFAERNLPDLPVVIAVTYDPDEDDGKAEDEPPPGPGESGDRAKAASEVLSRHAAEIEAIPGVVGHGVGLVGDPAEGRVGIGILALDDAAAARIRQAIPDPLDGIPVEVKVTGPIRAQ